MSEEKSDVEKRREAQLSVFARVIEANKDALAADLESIIGSMDGVGTNPVVPEYVFREMFLPFFAGDNPPPYQVELGHWLKIAGNPFQPVDVINDIGDVIFTVPPIAKRDSIKPVENRTVDIATVVWKTQQMGQVSRAHADAFIANTMIPHSEKMLDGQHAAVLADVREWNEIYKRYDRPVIEIPTDAVAVEIKPKEQIDYDDWEPI